jgi:hypothetical protein
MDSKESFFSGSRGGDECLFKQTLPRIKNIGENVLDTLQDTNTNSSIDFQGS